MIDKETSNTQNVRSHLENNPYRYLGPFQSNQFDPDGRHSRQPRVRTIRSLACTSSTPQPPSPFSALASKPPSKPLKSYSIICSQPRKMRPLSVPHTLIETLIRQPRCSTQPPTKSSPSTCLRTASNRSRPSYQRRSQSTACKRSSHSSTPYIKPGALASWTRHEFSQEEWI